jgi:hypothetical protein
MTFGLGLAGRPGGGLPFAHLGKIDDWNWHGGRPNIFRAGKK